MTLPPRLLSSAEVTHLVSLLHQVGRQLDLAAERLLGQEDAQSAACLLLSHDLDDLLAEYDWPGRDELRERTSHRPHLTIVHKE